MIVVHPDKKLPAGFSRLIINTVCNYYGLSKEVISQRSHNRTYSQARKLCIHFSLLYTRTTKKILASRFKISYFGVWQANDNVSGLIANNDYDFLYVYFKVKERIDEILRPYHPNSYDLYRAYLASEGA